MVIIAACTGPLISTGVETQLLCASLALTFSVLLAPRKPPQIVGDLRTLDKTREPGAHQLPCLITRKRKRRPGSLPWSAARNECEPLFETAPVGLGRIRI